MNGDFAGQAPRPILPGQYVGNDFVPFSTSSPMPVGGPAASDAAVSGNPLLTGGRASTATPTAVNADGDAVALWANRNGALRVDPTGTTTQPVSGTLNAQGSEARDAALTQNPVIVGGRASTATPSAVSADNDVVDVWLNRNGAVRVDPVGTTAQPVTDNGGSLTVDGTITNTPNVFVPATRTASQVTATTSSGVVVAADANRRLLVITNTGSVTVYLDPSGTAATTDYPLPAGASVTMTSLDGDGMAQAQWSCITASSTAVLGVLTAVA